MSLAHPSEETTQLSADGGRDSWAKVRGETRYTRDVQLPGMLYAAVVRSPYAHARITSIQTKEAERMDGVRAVLTGEDIRYGRFGRSVQDIPVLASGEVRYVGERVAAVAADSEALAEAAAESIEVTYEPLPATVSHEHALETQAPAVHDCPWDYEGSRVKPDDPRNLQSVEVQSQGDVDAAFDGAEYIFEEVFRTATQHQGYLEPHVSTALVRDEIVEIWTANKGPHRLRQQLSKCLGKSPEQIWIHPVAIGGDFGGKGSPMDAPLAVALAEATGRPVQVRMRYTDELMAGDPRHPSVTRVRLALDGSGRFKGLDVDVLLNGGAYAGYKPKPTVNLDGVKEVGGPYRIPAARVSSRVVYTHTVPRGHMRAPGSPQVNFALESLIDEAAAALGFSPLELRTRNILTTGEPDAFGALPVEARGPEVIEAVESIWRASFDRREIPKPPHPWVLGCGMALYRRDTHGGKTEVALEPTPFGILVRVGFGDQGGGQFAVVKNVVHRELGVPREAIKVQQMRPGAIGFDSGVGGSRVTLNAAEALGLACEKIKRRLSLASGVSSDQVLNALSDFARSCPGDSFSAVVDLRDIPLATSFCMHLAQVRVDPGTGQVLVDRIVTVADVAHIINPLTHQIQIEGGTVQGLGQAVLEELPFDEGRVVVTHLGEYKIPSIRDVPTVEVVLLPGGRGVGRANLKAVGELANVSVQAAIANAVADAVGVRIKQLPVTAERVYAALQRGTQGG